MTIAFAAPIAFAACLAPFQAAPAVPPAASLRVGLVLDPPFAERTADGRIDGFSVGIADAVAVRSRMVPEYRVYGSLEELYRAVAAGEVDVGAGNTLATSARRATVAFTQPVMEGGLRVMVPSDRRHTFARLWKGLVDDGHVAVVAWGAAITVACSLLLALALRRIDREFTRHWHEGFSEALYHVVSVTMTGKTSYRGNVAPAWVGRIFAAMWLVFGVASVAYLTSSLTSVMSASAAGHAVNGPKDLKGKAVATLRGGVGDRYCAEHGLDVVRFGSIDEAAAAVGARTVDALVADAASLEYFDTSHPDVPVTVVGEAFQPRHFAMAVRPDDAGLARAVDVAVLGMREDGSLDALRHRWFGH